MRCLLISLLLLSSLLSAKITPETEGMEATFRSDGTFLTASPTYIFDRVFGEGGLHSASEVWSPDFIANRLLVNRYSVLPSWQVQEPGIWLKTGNEVGDMIYQDLITLDDDRPENRNPTLEAGFRSVSFHGFWATARYFQVDHFSSAALKNNKRAVGSADYAFFGANLPAFSTAYGGLGYSGDLLEFSLLAGREYLWLFGESGRWIPALISPRVESRIHYRSLDFSLIYEDIEYKNVELEESGTRKEWSGSLYFPYTNCCKTARLEAGGGINFRFVNDKGDTYFGLKNDRVFWTFMQMKWLPQENFSVGGHFGMNENNWLVKDSIEIDLKTGLSSNLLFGFQNLLGSRLNPMGESYEFFNGDTIALSAEGFLQLYKIYAQAEHGWSPFKVGIQTSIWLEKGAETFDTTGFEKVNDNIWYRYGSISRINSWLTGLMGELTLSYEFNDLFLAKARGGVEQIWGKEERFEIEPSEAWFALEANWTIRKTLLISHSWHYRSDARWNLRRPDPFEIRGDWFWNASFSQLFPKQGLTLTGTLLHVLSDTFIEVPNGNKNRTRFICSVKKAF